jgi:ABC-type transporter Mla subunit MlaD
MSDDIMELVILVMLEAAEEHAADLKAIMDEIRRRNERLCRWRKLAADLHSHKGAVEGDAALLSQASDAAAEQLQSISDITETMQLRLQMYMDRRSKFVEALSNIMKKQSDTAAAIIANLK